jgi:hypothetical protein
MRRLYSKTAIRRNGRLTLAAFRCLATVRFGCEAAPFHASASQGFSLYSRQVRQKTKLKSKSRGRSQDGAQACSPSLSAPDKRKATHSPPWLFRGVRVEAREHPDLRTHPFSLWYSWLS